MIYTPLTYRAMRIAYDAHHGQTDKAGAPYIFHPFHLAEQMPDEASCCAALLHDVVEDTAVTLDVIAAEFPPEVVDAVRLLTHEKGTDYLEYVHTLKNNTIARTVKLADLDHNSDESRWSDASAEQRAYFREKYRRARKILMEE